MSAIEALQNIVRLVRNGQVRDEFPLFYHSVAALVAAVGDALFPLEPTVGAAAIDDALLADACDCLADAKSQLQAFAADGAEKLDPATIALLIDLAVKLITKWLEKRRS